LALTSRELTHKDTHTRARAPFTQSLGLAFQVIDDILDVTQTSEKLGKSAGKDVAVKRRHIPLYSVWKSRAAKRSG